MIMLVTLTGGGAAAILPFSFTSGMRRLHPARTSTRKFRSRYLKSSVCYIHCVFVRIPSNGDGDYGSCLFENAMA